MMTENRREQRYREILQIVREETGAEVEDLAVRRVLARLRVPPRRLQARVRLRLFLWLGAGGIAATAAALFMWLAPHPAVDTPPLSSVDSGVVALVRASGLVARQTHAGVAVSAGAIAFAPGERAELGARASLDFEVGERARLSFAGPATLRRDADRVWTLSRGLVHVWVNPAAVGPPFVLRAGGDEIIVTGTELSVAVDASSRASVVVRRGHVLVRGDRARRAVEVSAGERVGEAVGVLDPFAKEAPVLSAPWWGGGDLHHPSGYVSLLSEPTEADASVAGVAVGVTPVLVRWPAGQAALTLSAARRPLWHTRLDVAAGQTTRVAAHLENEAALSPQHKPKAPTALPTWQELLAQGRCADLGQAMEGARGLLLVGECHVRRTERAEALVAYREVTRAYPPTAEVEVAWFEVARIAGDLGDDEAARAGIDAYLKSFARGRFAADIALRRCELEAKERRLEAARRCLDEQLAKHPEAVRRTAALRLQASVCRAQGDFVAAQATYRELLARRDLGDDAEQVRYQVVEVTRLGRLTGLDASIADYLTHHPNGPHAAEVRRLRP